jgi:hypothetical protein
MHSPQHSSSALLAVFGPSVTGALLAIHSSGGIWAMGRNAVALPLVIGGVAAVMLPALYIATTLAGAAPSAQDFGAAALRALRAFGLVLCGVTAPVAFVLATSTSSHAAIAIGGLTVLAGAAACLRVLFSDLFGDARRSLALRGACAAWAALTLAIGVHMMARFILV